MITPPEADGSSYQPLDTLTREFDISALPWVSADDYGGEQEPPDVPVPPQAPPPPPSSRQRAERASTRDIVGGAAADTAASAPPRSVITIPKPPARVVAPRTELGAGHRYLGATLPPLERSAEPSAEIIVDRGSRLEKGRQRRVVLAGGLLALGLLGAGAVVFLRRGESPRIEGHSTPAFLATDAPTTEPSTTAHPANAPAPPAVPADDATAPTPSIAAAAPSEPSLEAPPPSATDGIPRVETAPVVAASTSGAGAEATIPKPGDSDVAVPKDESEPRSAAAESTVGKEPSSERASRPRGTTPPSRAPIDRGVTRSPGVRPPNAAVDPITTYTFSADDLFAIATAPKRMTDLILQPGEKLVTRPTPGDGSLWVIHVVDGVQRGEPQQHVQVTPLRDGTATNLTLTTTRRNYHLELTSSTAGPYMAAVHWHYPVDDAQRRLDERARLAREHDRTARVDDVKALRFEYAIRVTAGKPAWTPTTIFDDGSHTFIKFPAPVSAERAPLLFILRSGGTKNAEYVNYRIRGDLYVIDRLIDTAELRLPTDGGAKQQVVRITRSES